MSNLYFNLTCGACPEQYNVYLSEDEFNKDESSYIAYIRLRWGYLSCEVYSNNESIEVFSHQFDDEWKGIFDDEDERKHYLSLIETAITNFFNLNQ